ncbi:MAG: hypothetical protein GC182_04965 [Rhodopseudomonas sp.]|nr:hypothetical protein [Rhodopseudomonas sp.]
MATAKCLRRQAATCANLARETYDEESRERYIRLEQLYLQLADSEEPAEGQPSGYTGEGRSETPVHRAN